MPDFYGCPLTSRCKYAQNFMEEVIPMGWELDGSGDHANKPDKNKFDGFP